MNAIELLAVKSQITFENVDDTYRMYEMLLEKVEVCINDSWLPVKEKGRNIYYPNDIENDIDAISALTEFVLQYLQSVFMKSNKSKQEQA